MRFLKIFFTVLIVLSILVAAIFFSYRSIILTLATNTFRRDWDRIKILAADNNKTHALECQEKLKKEAKFIGEKIDENIPPKPPLAYQLRFISPTEYVIEYVCRKPEVAIEISRAKLTWGVAKLSGSGIRYPVWLPGDKTAEIKAMVMLGFQGNTENIGEEGEDAPEAECRGWGMQCCIPLTEIGEGNQELRVTDCRGLCFNRCTTRPAVLFFNSDPLMDAQSRTLALNGSVVKVRLGWEIVDADHAIKNIKINFGDGEAYQSEVAHGITEHTYRCHSSECVYEAEISARDDVGYETWENRVSYIHIVMKGK